MSSGPTGYWSEAFYNGFLAPWLDKHASTNNCVGEAEALLPAALFLRVLEFLQSLPLEKQGDSNIVRDPTQKVQEGLKKDLKCPNK